MSGIITCKKQSQIRKVDQTKILDMGESSLSTILNFMKKQFNFQNEPTNSPCTSASLSPLP